jgi:putative exosortase-associated protein (TIGR04073 family)
MKTPFFLAIVVAAGLLVAGCAGPEQKLGRGLANSVEFARGGEFRRSVEQAGVFGEPDYAYTTGVIRGVNRTIGRTLLGLYEVVTFPIPSYDPILTRYYSAAPAYPANYKPGLMEDSMFDRDTSLDFSGGDVMPFVPGSRFRIFDN